MERENIPSMVPSNSFGAADSRPSGDRYAHQRQHGDVILLPIGFGAAQPISFPSRLNHPAPISLDHSCAWARSTVFSSPAPAADGRTSAPSLGQRLSEINKITVERLFIGAPSP